MSESQFTNRSSYEHLAQTEEWLVIDRAIHELAQNCDLVETTAHEYIVGYLCKALAETGTHQPLVTTTPEGLAVARERRRAALSELSGAIRIANPAQRDLVAELIAERRLEAECD